MSANRGAGGVADTQDQQQMKILADAKKVIASEAFLMKRALDNNKIMEAINHASLMVDELRTSLLNPQEYYELYMEAFNELKYLEAALYDDRDKHGKKMSELYELVQYAGNIVPRLYLLITVASAYIRSKEAPIKEILRDTVEMCKGVQHPTRGLFLRNYLSDMTKDKLPDLSSDPMDGDVRDSVDFILNNFTEMNKLWVRLHMGPLREREKREAQRKALRTLVGKNLSHLNSLEGIDVEMYKDTILPRILTQIVECHDRLAQQFLMEIVVQVFPDEFHLATLDMFLDNCTKLVQRVDLKNILASLIDRLASFALTSQSSINAQTLFDTFEKYIQRLGTEAQSDDPTDVDTINAAAAAAAAGEAGSAAAAAAASQVTTGKKPRLVCRDYLSLQACLENLCLRCFKDTPSFVSTILNNVNEYLTKLKASEPELLREPASLQQLYLLMSQPIDAYNDSLRVLSLQSYGAVSSHLVFEKRKQLHITLLQNLVSQNTPITSVENVSLVLSFVTTLIHDESDGPDAASIDEEDFMDEQHLVASSVHLLENSEPETLFRMYFTARKSFGVGGKNRIIYTLPPIVFGALRLVSRTIHPPLTEDNRKFAQTLFKFIHDTAKALQDGYGQTALRLFLQAAHTASNCGMENYAYEFVSESMTIYEDDIAGSAEQFSALTLIIGTLYNITFSAENAESYETLITKAAKHSLKLMRHNDQCHAVCMSAHLFWRSLANAEASNVGRDGKRVLECLQKSLKVADSSMNAASNVLLFVEILNQYIYFFEHKNECVAVKYLTSIISLINTNIASLESTADGTAAIRAFYKNTLDYIKYRKEHPSDRGVSFAEISL